MARSRITIASSVATTDEFLDLPWTCQGVYFQLAFCADNDGAIDGINRHLRGMGVSRSEIQPLFEQKYLIDIDGVVFIRHWWVNNIYDKYNYHQGQHKEQAQAIFRGKKDPYELPDFEQTSDSLQAVKIGNDTSAKVTGKDTDIISLNFENEKDSEKTSDSLSESGPPLAPCPTCGQKWLIGRSGHEWHGHCDECDEDFFINADGEPGILNAS